MIWLSVADAPLWGSVTLSSVIPTVTFSSSSRLFFLIFCSHIHTRPSLNRSVEMKMDEMKGRPLSADLKWSKTDYSLWGSDSCVLMFAAWTSQLRSLSPSDTMLSHITTVCLWWDCFWFIHHIVSFSLYILFHVTVTDLFHWYYCKQQERGDSRGKQIL